MKNILLSKGQVAIIDDDDFWELAQWKWNIGGSGYAERTRRVGEQWHTMIIRMHCWIMRPPKKMEVDHINGNKLDNRRENLRVITSSQNKMNQGVRKNNKLGVKGIYFHEKRKRFIAQIQANGKSFHLGYFVDLESAKAAYSKAVMEHHGEFAHRN